MSCPRFATILLRRHLYIIYIYIVCILMCGALMTSSGAFWAGSGVQDFIRTDDAADEPRYVSTRRSMRAPPRGPPHGPGVRGPPLAGLRIRDSSSRLSPRTPGRGTAGSSDTRRRSWAATRRRGPRLHVDRPSGPSYRGGERPSQTGSRRPESGASSRRR